MTFQPQRCHSIVTVYYLRRCHSMKKRKIYRMQCVNETCRKRFRHADPRARTCSQACRKAVSRARRKAREDAERAETYKQLLQIVRSKKGQQEAEGQGAAAEHPARVDRPEHSQPASPPPPPAPRRKRRRNIGGLGSLDDPQPVERIAIPLPKRAPMTPLPKR